MSKLYYAPFVLGVPNSAPTDISLSATSVSEEDPSGTSVGTLTTTDADAGDTHIYTLVAGSGDTDNASFSIGGAGSDELLTEVAASSGEALDITGSPFSVRLRTTDDGALFFEEAFAIEVSSGILLLSEDFEGTAPTGWSDEWDIACPMDCVTSITTSEEGTPDGGGTYAWRQHWAVNKDNPDYLTWTFPDEGFSEGDVFEFEYYLKYHANFTTDISPPNGAGVAIKQHIIKGGNQVGEFYIHTWTYGWRTDGRLSVNFQQAGDAPNHRASNINGDNYIMPKGTWVHFRWRIKVAEGHDQTDPTNGFLRGWVDGELRWTYDNIATCFETTYAGGQMNFNSTFNNGHIKGPDQRRYWDNFKLRVISSG